MNERQTACTTLGTERPTVMQDRELSPMPTGRLECASAGAALSNEPSQSAERTDKELIPGTRRTFGSRRDLAGIRAKVRARPRGDAETLNGEGGFRRSRSPAGPPDRPISNSEWNRERRRPQRLQSPGPLSLRRDLHPVLVATEGQTYDRRIAR